MRQRRIVLAFAGERPVGSRGLALIGDVNGDALGAVADERETAAGSAAHRGRPTSTSGNSTAANPDADGAVRPIAQQGEKDAVGSDLGRFYFELFDRGYFALSRSVEKTRPAGRIDRGNFLIMRWGRLVDSHVGRV